MKHPHHDIIVAWAANTNLQIQCRSGDKGEWMDLSTNISLSPCWHAHWQYRIKPEPVVYYINGNRPNSYGRIPAGLAFCLESEATHELTYEDGKFVSLKEINK